MVSLGDRHVDNEIGLNLGQRALEVVADIDVIEAKLRRSLGGGILTNVDPAADRRLVAIAQVFAPGATHSACANNQGSVWFHALLAIGVERENVV